MCRAKSVGRGEAKRQKCRGKSVESFFLGFLSRQKCIAGQTFMLAWPGFLSRSILRSKACGAQLRKKPRKSPAKKISPQMSESDSQISPSFGVWCPAIL